MGEKGAYGGLNFENLLGISREGFGCADAMREDKSVEERGVSRFFNLSHLIYECALSRERATLSLRLSG